MLPDIPLIRVLAFSHFWHFRNAGSSLTQLHPSVCLPGPGVAVWNLPRLDERASECKTFSVEVREREVKFWMQEHKPWNARIFGTRIAKARLRNACTLDGRPSLHTVCILCYLAPTVYMFSGCIVYCLHTRFADYVNHSPATQDMYEYTSPPLFSYSETSGTLRKLNWWRYSLALCD